MTDLPIPIAYGWWISKMLVVAVAMLTTVVLLQLRRWSDLVCARRYVHRLAAGASALGEGAVTLRGRLHGGVISTRHHPVVEPHALEMIASDSGSRWIDVNGTRVDLDSNVIVRRGSASKSSWWGAKRASQAANAAHFRIGSRTTHIVRDGDEVIVVGKARLRDPDPATDEQGRWVMSSPIILNALRPVACPRALGPWILAVLVGTGAIGYFGLRTYGSHLIESAIAGRDRDHRMPRQLSSFEPLVIAAALPGSRDNALEVLLNQLDGYIGRTEIATRQKIALASRSGCARKTRALVEAGHYEEALTASDGCSDAVRVEVLLLLGYYTEAARLATSANSSPRARVLALIATRRWSEAASVIDTIRAPAGEEVRFRCVAEWMRSNAGDSTARARILALAAQNRSGACQLSSALLEDPAARPDALVVARHALASRTGDRDPHEFVASQLAWIYGALMRDRSGAMTALVDPSPPSTVEAWLARFARDLRDSAAVWTWSAVHDVYRGDFEAAMNDVSRAGHAPSGEESSPDLDIAVQLHGAQMPLDVGRVVTSPVGAILALRRGDSVGLPRDLVAVECEVDVAPAFKAAVNGDARQLADLLETCRPATRVWSLILAIAPHVRQHRERLANAAFRAYDRQDSDRDLPFKLVHDLTWTRDLARSTGALGTAARMQAIIDRHLDAFGTREHLAAVLLWSAL